MRQGSARTPRMTLWKTAIHLGPLHGLPITVKDTLDVAGLPATYGIPAFAQNIPDNAASVQRLLDAGAIVLRKTNTPLFAGDWQTYNEVYGTTNNP